ncbi:MAG: AAA family ATPase [Candidatus Saccharimonadales bacterium]
MNKIVFVNGYPASGKTSLLSELRHQRVPSPILAKDDIKEPLFRLLNLSTKEHGKQLNELVIAFMCQQLGESLRAGTPLILEANFKPIYDQASFGAILKDYNVAILQVLITAPAEVLLARDTERFNAGERHEGHEPLRIDSIYATQIDIVKHFDFDGAHNITVNSVEITDGYKQLAGEITDFITN